MGIRTLGDGCSWYNSNTGSCGEHDDDGFRANKMCCSCGGGCTDADNGKTDQWQRMQLLINTGSCGDHDDDFKVNEMCSCGGGDSEEEETVEEGTEETPGLYGQGHGETDSVATDAAGTIQIMAMVHLMTRISTQPKCVVPVKEIEEGTEETPGCTIWTM